MTRPSRSAIRTLLTLAATAALAFTATTTAAADVAAPEQDPLTRYTTDPAFAAQVDDVAMRFAEGVATEADRAWVMSMPDLAMRMVDGSKTTTNVEVNVRPAPQKQGGSLTPMAVTCKSTDRYSNWYSVWPSTLVYRYHTRADFCYDGYKVTSVRNNYGYFTDVDPIYNVVSSNVINSVVGTGTTRTVHTQGHIQACVAFKVGCFSNFYPWGKVKLNGSGTTSFTSGE